MRAALNLADAGANSFSIATQLGVPSRTVRDWLAGRVPRLPRVLDPNVGRCERCGGYHDLPSLGAPYAHLLGLYLGDGCLSVHPRGVYRLRIVLDQRYPAIVADACGSVRAVSGGSVGKLHRSDHCIEVYSYWKQWPCHFPQHSEGPKHLRPIVLTDWQRQLVERWPDQLLRGLIESDGCRFQNTGRGRWSNPRYAFSNRSADIHAIFRTACERLGLRWTEAKPYTTYVSRKADVARMDAFIGPKR